MEKVYRGDRNITMNILNIQVSGVQLIFLLMIKITAPVPIISHTQATFIENWIISNIGINSKTKLDAFFFSDFLWHTNLDDQLIDSGSIFESY